MDFVGISYQQNESIVSSGGFTAFGARQTSAEEERAWGGVRGWLPLSRAPNDPRENTWKRTGKGELRV